MANSETLVSPESYQEEFPPVVTILDAGAQYVDMIKKACERSGFPAVVLPIDTHIDDLPDTTKAIVVSGGPASSHVDGSPQPDESIWSQDDIPSLNICYGMQAMALHAGGSVSTREYRTDDRITTNLDDTNPLFAGIRKETTALFTHGDYIESVPDNVEVIGHHKTSKGDDVISAISIGNHVGVQFHPEALDDTPQGYEMFGNFFRYIADAKPDERYLATQMERQIGLKQLEIKERVGDKHVIAFVSGGVDSVTATTLANSVIDPEKMHMYYIDNGYMRDEDEDVIETLVEAGLNVHKIEAQEAFEQATAVIDGKVVGPLIDVVNPVHKRRISGERFVDIKDEIVEMLGLSQDEVVLLQGTNAADRIESGVSKGGNDTEQIKEHHNMVKRVRDLNPLEPLDDLFKDEVRALAVALGLPEEIAYRQPFPGPGTAIRILGLDEGGFNERPKEHQLALNRALDSMNEQFGTDLNCQLFPVRSVGVGGDSRSHIEAVALEGLADSQSISNIANTLTNDFRGLTNRVVYKLDGPTLDTLIPKQTKPDREMRDTVRHADRITHEVMREMGLMRSIEQMPVVLLPIGSEDKRSIVLRPIKTRTHMTVQAMLPDVHLPREFFDQVTNRILSEVDGISHVFLDATDKPPGTTEWE